MPFVVFLAIAMYTTDVALSVVYWGVGYGLHIP